MPVWGELTKNLLNSKWKVILKTLEKELSQAFVCRWNLVWYFVFNAMAFRHFKCDLSVQMFFLKLYLYKYQKHSSRTHKGLQSSLHYHGFEWRFQCSFNYRNQNKQKSYYGLHFGIRSPWKEVENQRKKIRKVQYINAKIVHHLKQCKVTVLWRHECGSFGLHCCFNTMKNDDSKSHLSRHSDKISILGPH